MFKGTMAWPNTNKNSAEKAADLIIDEYVENNNKCDIHTDWYDMAFRKDQLKIEIEHAIDKIMKGW